MNGYAPEVNDLGGALLAERVAVQMGL